MAEVDRTIVRSEPLTVFHLVAAFAFDDRKDSRQPLGILPDVRAVSRAAIHTFVQVVHAVLLGQPFGHLGLHAIQWDKRSFQEPMGQRGVVPGVGPALGCRMQFPIPAGHGARGIRRGWPLGGIEVDVGGSRPAAEPRDIIRIGKTPGQCEGNSFLFAGLECQSAPDRGKSSFAEGSFVCLVIFRIRFL